ncbi:diiron oxygenase [Thalassospiraceae bacterium LMO-JJ14]|nr:diiron oxygenase [Thalassospiraceae bacterium LMO-JJ14]
MSTIFNRLAAAVPPYKDPMNEIDWAGADPELPWLPDSMISLSSLPVWNELDENKKRQVSRVEFARLCAAGLWLEGLMIHRVTHAGFVAADTLETQIVLQEVREETGHSLMFLKMIERAGMSGKHLLGPTGLLTTVAKMLNPKGAGFWAMVFIGESVTDTFALKALKEADGEGQAICPLARQVMQWHHADEARHIAAAKALLGEKIKAMSAVERAGFRLLTKLLIRRFLSATLFPSLQSLEALQFPNAREVWRQAHRSPAGRSLAESCAEPAMKLIDKRFSNNPQATASVQ